MSLSKEFTERSGTAIDSNGESIIFYGNGGFSLLPAMPARIFSAFSDEHSLLS
jgi:hypothetical protein